MSPSDERQVVTNEALNMLEVYLNFESLDDAVMEEEVCDIAVQGDTNAIPDFVPVTNSLRKKFALGDPLNRARKSLAGLARPVKLSNDHCALCGTDVSEIRRKSRSALSAQCSPERLIPLETRHSLPFGCERLLQTGRRRTTCDQDQNNPVFVFCHTEEPSDTEELVSPCPLPVIELPPLDSQPQPVCDKVEGSDPFQRQQSSFSNSASLGQYSLPALDVPSRTPSQLKAHSLVQNALTPRGDGPPGWVMRSHSAGSNVLQKQNLIQPGVHWPPQFDSVDSAYSYTRCESVHSAPGDARNNVKPSKVKRDSTRKWFRFSLSKIRRKSSRPSDHPRDSQGFDVIPNSTEDSVNEGIPATQKQSRPSRPNLGLDSLLHLIPRWFRGQDMSPDPYVAPGFPVRLRRSMFRNVSRRKRRKACEQTIEKTMTDGKSTKRVPQLSPIYIPDRLNERCTRVREDCTAPNGIPSTPQVNSPAPNGSIGDLAGSNRLTSPTVLSEVSRLYEEIIHTAEGGRLGESTVQLWRSVTDQAVTTDSIPVSYTSFAHAYPIFIQMHTVSAKTG
ncbi:unnamed protein product [Echinostoma caproni]|uniref:SH2 domain-containing protein n=1 Tax=Echinostoma caproni TaxID=27848 RepID=A0A183AK11_9TREM|nr:unnamed protein product [Echinostoma caproni]